MNTLASNPGPRCEGSGGLPAPVWTQPLRTSKEHAKCLGRSFLTRQVERSNFAHCDEPPLCCGQTELEPIGGQSQPCLGPWGRQVGGRQRQKAEQMPEPGATPACCVTSGKPPALSGLGVSSSVNERIAGMKDATICWACYRGSSLDLFVEQTAEKTALGQVQQEGEGARGGEGGPGEVSRRTPQAEATGERRSRAEGPAGRKTRDTQDGVPSTRLVPAGWVWGEMREPHPAPPAGRDARPHSLQ